MCRSRLPAHYGFETNKNIARSHQIAVPRRSTSLADGNPVNLALGILEIHTLIFLSGKAQTRLARSVLVHQGDGYTPLDTARLRIFLTGPPGDKPLNPLVLEQSPNPTSHSPLFDKTLTIVSTVLSVLVLAKNTYAWPPAGLRNWRRARRSA